MKLEDADEVLQVKGKVQRVTVYIEEPAKGDNPGFRDALHFTAEEWAAVTPNQLKQQRVKRVVDHFNRLNTPPPVETSKQRQARIRRTKADLAQQMAQLEEELAVMAEEELVEEQEAADADLVEE